MRKVILIALLLVFALSLKTVKSHNTAKKAHNALSEQFKEGLDQWLHTHVFIDDDKCTQVCSGDGDRCVLDNDIWLCIDKSDKTALQNEEQEVQNAVVYEETEDCEDACTEQGSACSQVPEGYVCLDAETIDHLEDIQQFFQIIKDYVESLENQQDSKETPAHLKKSHLKKSHLKKSAL